jgi:hypothetical protein
MIIKNTSGEAIKDINRKIGTVRPIRKINNGCYGNKICKEFSYKREDEPLIFEDVVISDCRDEKGDTNNNRYRHCLGEDIP